MIYSESRTSTIMEKFHWEANCVYSLFSGFTTQCCGGAHTHRNTAAEKPPKRRRLIQCEQWGISIKMISCINMLDNMRKSSATGVYVCLGMCVFVHIRCLYLPICLAVIIFSLVCIQWAQKGQKTATKRFMRRKKMCITIYFNVNIRSNHMPEYTIMWRC